MLFAKRSRSSWSIEGVGTFINQTRFGGHLLISLEKLMVECPLKYAELVGRLAIIVGDLPPKEMVRSKMLMSGKRQGFSF
jgi:hypothetical protein